MQIINGKLETSGIGSNAMGGTEMMAHRVASLEPELLKEFQIIISRVEHTLDPTKIRILYIHDLLESTNEHLAEGGWKKFHKIVFVSNWQMQQFVNYYSIPWSRCIVLQNAIDPIPLAQMSPSNPESMKQDKWYMKGINESTPLKFIYHSTPDKGIEILVPVFEKLCETHDNLELDIFSSFGLYGWTEKDKMYEPLFEQCKNHPKINYHATQSNETVRKALQEAHIFAHPSTNRPETSCIALIEAMSAGCICIHSNYGALYETAANWTDMYHYHEDRNEHAKILYTALMNTIDDVKEDVGRVVGRVRSIKSYTDIFYSWKPNREVQWRALFGMLLAQVKNRGFEEASDGVFHYKVV